MASRPFSARPLPHADATVAAAVVNEQRFSLAGDLCAGDVIALPSALPATVKKEAANHGFAASRPMRVLLVASAGGHWIELCRLSAAFAACDCQYVSTAPGLTAPLGFRDVLQIPDSSRDTVRTMARTFTRLVPIIRDFDPEMVVSTGAAPGALGLFIGKYYGARTIWVDSIANSEVLSLSGRLVRLFADLRLTQWPELEEKSGKLRCFGKVL
ncbi:hypothetical protein BH10PSE14_BH10PSE14_31660 [soil metagenome]